MQRYSRSNEGMHRATKEHLISAIWQVGKCLVSAIGRNHSSDSDPVRGRSAVIADVFMNVVAAAVED